MPTCTVSWRPSGGKALSGGRGEFEFVPSTSLTGREVFVRIDELSTQIDSEVYGIGGGAQGKPRLRKLEKNNRQKLHLVALVMAMARLPDPAREDKLHKVEWPLENKAFIVSHVEFEVLESDAEKAVLRPLLARILHSDRTIDLVSRFTSIAADLGNLAKIKAEYPDLGAAIERHAALVTGSPVNGANIRDASADVIREQARVFGSSNAASITLIETLPPTDLEEDIKGKEGRVLTRLHSYRERDRNLIKMAKTAFKTKHGKLYCECCGGDPLITYGERGDGRVHAHHRTPVEELLPDSITTAEDLAMLCPNCHDIIHAKRPWITVEGLRELLAEQKAA